MPVVSVEMEEVRSSAAAEGNETLEARALNSPLLGFAGAAFALVGIAFLTPLVLRGIDRVFGRTLKRLVGFAPVKDFDYALRSPRRRQGCFAAPLS